MTDIKKLKKDVLEAISEHQDSEDHILIVSVVNAVMSNFGKKNTEQWTKILNELKWFIEHSQNSINEDEKIKRENTKEKWLEEQGVHCIYDDEEEAAMSYIKQMSIHRLEVMIKEKKEAEND